MKEKDMTDTLSNRPPKKLDDPDIRLAETAIRRAALKARERARRFGHGIIIYENGKIVEKHPDKEVWKWLLLSLMHSDSHSNNKVMDLI